MDKAVVRFPDNEPDRWQILADLAYALDRDHGDYMSDVLDMVIEASPEPTDPSSDFEACAVSRFARVLRDTIVAADTDDEIPF